MKTKDHDIEQFTFYYSFKDAIRELQDVDKLQVYEAITDFAFFGREPGEMSAFSKLCWKLIKPHLERSRAHSGRGGAPIGNTNAKKNNQETTQKQRAKTTSLEKEIEIEIEDNKESSKEPKKKISLQPSAEETKFNDLMLETFPHVQRMEQPLTLEQFKKLGSDYGKDDVLETLQRMENWKPLSKQNRSAYRTAQKWLTTKK